MDLLRTKDAGSAASEIEAAQPELLERLDRAIPHALKGDESATGDYVESWRALTQRFLALAGRAQPDIVVSTEHGELVTLDLKDSARSAALDYQAVGAPFSPWVRTLGAGKGVAISLLSTLRELLPGFSPLPQASDDLSAPDWDVDRGDLWRFALSVLRHLRSGDAIMLRIIDVFDLSRTEAARLFGVRRQAVAQWLEDGIPPARLAKALRVVQIADLLERNLQRERIPATARTPAAAYDGRSMLEMIADDNEVELLELTRQSFDWAVPA